MTHQQNQIANHNKYLYWSLLSGIFASICWVVADLLLVGFTLDPSQYPLFAVTYADKVDVEFATLMLSGSTERLMWGVLVAVFALPFYCFALYGIWQLFHATEKKLATPLVMLWLTAFCFHPIGHGGFFYVAEIYKTIMQTDASAHPVLLQTADSFVQLLKINWMLALGLLSLSSILFALAVFKGKTKLPRWVGFINPFFISILIILITKMLPSPLSDWIACAVFNEANFIFFLTLFFAIKNNNVKQ